jgi:hypothetical protein
MNKEDGVIHFTETEKIKGDLIAMATHGRKGISHMAKGSIAEDVVNHTSSLVWTYKLNQRVAKPGLTIIEDKVELDELVLNQ